MRCHLFVFTSEKSICAFAFFGDHLSCWCCMSTCRSDGGDQTHSCRRLNFAAEESAETLQFDVKTDQLVILHHRERHALVADDSLVVPAWCSSPGMTVPPR